MIHKHITITEQSKAFGFHATDFAWHEDSRGYNIRQKNFVLYDWCSEVFFDNIDDTDWMQRWYDDYYDMLEEERNDERVEFKLEDFLAIRDRKRGRV